jgi:hypothetical protein
LPSRLGTPGKGDYLLREVLNLLSERGNVALAATGVSEGRQFRPGRSRNGLDLGKS